MALFRNIKKYDILFACAAAFYLICLFCSYSGAGISPDSIMYISAARSFTANGSLQTFNHIPIVDFPVFYPIFLGSVIIITHLDAVLFGTVLNSVLFSCLLFTCGWIMNRFKPSSQIYKWLMLTAIVLSPALLQVYSYLWSETLFILEIMFFIIAFREYQLKHTLKTLIIAAAIAAISCVTRYAAVTMIGTGGLLLLLDRTLILKKKVAHIILYGFVCISLLVANLVFNALHTGTSTGPREPSITSFGKNLYYFGTVMCDWMGFTPAHYFLALPLAIFTLLGFITALAYNYHCRHLNSYENLAITFSLVYGLFIILSSTFSRYERINHRLLSPLFITSLWAYTSWGVLWLKNFRKRQTRLITGTIMTLLMCGFITRELLTDNDRYRDQIADDYGNPGYTDSGWQESVFANYLRKTDKNMFDPHVTIYTDAHEAVYFFSGLSSYLVPHRYFKKDVNKFYRVKHFYLIWFSELDNPELISLKDIQKVKRLKLIKGFGAEGGIYEYDGSLN